MQNIYNDNSNYFEKRTFARTYTHLQQLTSHIIRAYIQSQSPISVSEVQQAKLNSKRDLASSRQNHFDAEIVCTYIAGIFVQANSLNERRKMDFFGNRKLPKRYRFSFILTFEIVSNGFTLPIFMSIVSVLFASRQNGGQMKYQIGLDCIRLRYQ